MSEQKTTAENSSTVGDAAKLREAVEYCLGVLNRIDWLGDGVFPNGKFIAPETLARAKQKATAAIDAPARNCDTKESIDAVVKRFKAENCDHYDNAFDDPRTQCHQNCVECVIKWMMANQIKKETK